MKLIINISIIINICFATFSIIAVDTLSQQVGSAGASCIGNSVIISDVKPGVGAIHTQSYYLQYNQNYASELMEEGLSPTEIIDLLIENDFQNNPQIRQYGIVDLNENGRSASFTGTNCIDFKGHISGPNYSIQGNILIGEDILNQMEYNFINTTGTLSEKLMAAMQGANIPGADSRCLDDEISSLSSFIRVANPEDDPENIFLDLRVANTFANLEPIDVLQNMYNDWTIENTSHQLGDINQDNIIDILDIITLVNFILGNIEPNLISGHLSDTNSDNIINIQDIIIIINYIINI
ncbi:MAG: secretion protein [Candidatus Marinimicrobia bacterium]|nr:secretion protein [Candidatus Neomarinimicrobiota bacterium]|tara:strand:+ start:1634 stop:2518 length:885 start_codon:yes stop_codon:yes gene_type:complete